MNGMDRQLRDLLEAAAGEPPHRVTAETVRRRVIRRRVAEVIAGAVAVAAIAALIPVGLGALGRGQVPRNACPVAPRLVTSRHYGYTEALPAGWRLVRQATRSWHGTGGPGYDRPVVDLFAGPHGIAAWAYAAPTSKSLGSYATATIRASRAAHPCSRPRNPNQAITIRRGIRPPAGHALPGRQRLPGGDRGQVTAAPSLQYRTRTCPKPG